MAITTQHRRNRRLGSDLPLSSRRVNSDAPASLTARWTSNAGYAAQTSRARAGGGRALGLSGRQACAGRHGGGGRSNETVRSDLSVDVRRDDRPACAQRTPFRSRGSCDAACIATFTLLPRLQVRRTCATVQGGRQARATSNNRTVVGGGRSGRAACRKRAAPTAPRAGCPCPVRLLVADGGHCTIEHTRPVKPDLAMRAGRQEITPYGRVPAAACAHRVACRTGAGSSLVQLARTTAGFARHDCSALAALRSHQSRSSRARQR